MAKIKYDPLANLRHTAIAKAVEPLRAEAIARAEKEAKEDIAQVKKTMEENAWDLNKVAPHPPRGMSAWDKQHAKMKRARAYFEHFVRRTSTDYHHDWQTRPYIVEMHDDMCERHIEMQKEMASAQYDMFIAKLCRKIGTHKRAKLEGNHVWGYSLLDVTFADKPDQTWKTQQITNRSVLGKFFYQWPSREIKPKVRKPKVKIEVNHPQADIRARIKQGHKYAAIKGNEFLDSGESRHFCYGCVGVTHVIHLKKLQGTK